jgi:hypothetical protein
MAQITKKTVKTDFRLFIYFWDRVSPQTPSSVSRVLGLQEWSLWIMSSFFRFILQQFTYSQRKRASGWLQDGHAVIILKAKAQTLLSWSSEFQFCYFLNDEIRVLDQRPKLLICQVRPPVPKCQIKRPGEGRERRFITRFRTCRGKRHSEHSAHFQPSLRYRHEL